ncbi:gamma-glutamyltransferase [Bradyrhizobium sp. CSS354]|uniref:gamma-glutamyltransferase n=1 Tax=Bradyrhizobium sp. CSS354 TaxID=2699172 RepID=UPI0023B17B0B|nr:gamma-glutamyltransferase [Bradyrhizobium sp. CSS354]MDE5466154.1 gamma-glutamyltransferase [Bradyrhizobium sp. CSS354]
MFSPTWRKRAGTLFDCEKRSADSARGMVVTNHPLGSAAALEMLAAGGNAVDGAVAAQFALTVVEPMMVGLIGGTTCNIRLADGGECIIDGMSSVPLAGHPTMFKPIPGTLEFVVERRENQLGPKAVATPGSLLAWTHALRVYGTMSLADVMQPAIRHATRGFIVTPYLSECIGGAAADLLLDPLAGARLVPNGTPLKPGERLIQADYGEALTLIAKQGESALHGGSLGDQLVECMEHSGGFLSRKDLTSYRVVERQPIRASYRGWEVVGPPPPAASGVHIAQMLNILEGFDLAKLGFGTVEALHLLAEVMKIAFADRGEASGDPDFVQVPVERIVSKAYAEQRRKDIDMKQAKHWTGTLLKEGADTTHLTVADSKGNIVTTTQTINSTFGARFIVPGLGMFPNDYMSNFDPRPGSALSIQPGKRVTTSMSPVMALKDGRVRYALGLPGGSKIFPSALQALINLIDHRMSLQEAFEAPRIWTNGDALELEPGIPEHVRQGLASRGHRLALMTAVAGGTNGIAFNDDGSMTGAACWRADGTPAGLSGGLARAGVRFLLSL